MTALYGHARVSTLDQDLSIQQSALKRAGYQVICAEKTSGARRDSRTELQILPEFLRAGDTLDIIFELKAKGVALKAAEQPVDTGTAAGKAFLDMLGVFAEFETQSAGRAPARGGISAAKARGVCQGRRSTPPRCCARAGRNSSGRRRSRGARHRPGERLSPARQKARVDVAVNGGGDAD